MIYGLVIVLGLGAGVYTQAAFAVIQAVVAPADAPNGLTLMLLGSLLCSPTRFLANAVYATNSAAPYSSTSHRMTCSPCSRNTRNPKSDRSSPEPATSCSHRSPRPCASKRLMSSCPHGMICKYRRFLFLVNEILTFRGEVSSACMWPLPQV